MIIEYRESFEGQGVIGYIKRVIAGFYDREAVFYPKNPREAILLSTGNIHRLAEPVNELDPSIKMISSPDLPEDFDIEVQRRFGRFFHGEWLVDGRGDGVYFRFFADLVMFYEKV